jgi:hypothetical protein
LAGQRPDPGNEILYFGPAGRCCAKNLHPGCILERRGGRKADRD